MTGDNDGAMDDDRQGTMTEDDDRAGDDDSIGMMTEQGTMTALG